MTDDRNEWPAWATEKVEIVEADPSWHAQGIHEIERLRSLLGHLGVTCFEHVGSTAVPGLPAKPIIDIMGPVSSFAIVNGIEEVLCVQSWHLVPPELDGRPWRRFFIKVEPNSEGIEQRAAHLHLMLEDEPRWREQLLFRDALRADSALTQAYGQLKRRLALQHAGDREAYTAAKREFIESVLLGKKD